MGVFRTDSVGRYLFVNPRWCEIADLTPRAARGNGWLRGLHPDDRERVSREWHEAVRNDRPFRAEYRLGAADGATIWVLGTAMAVRATNGSVSGYVGTITDITSQKKTEMALRNRVREMSCVYALSHVVQRPHLDPPEMLNEVLGLIPSAWQYSEITSARIRLGDQEGRLGSFRETPWSLVSPILVHGEPAGSVEVVYLEERPQAFEGPFLEEERFLIDEIALRLGEAEERERAQAAARKVREELAHVARVHTLGQLTASLAHELRQPFTAILSNAQAAQRLLAAEPPLLGELRDALAEIVEDDQRGVAVIDRLRGLLKTGGCGRSALHINDVIRGVLTLVHSEAVEKRIAVDIDLADGLPGIRGDRVQIQQVVMNLVVNAFESIGEKITPPRRLLITTRRGAESTVQVSVADTGPGIEPRLLERLFDPFFTTKPEGLGMGLAICRTTVEEHGGRLWATRNRGRGATFHFTLPTKGDGRG